jgi:hypothetical protein
MAKIPPQLWIGVPAVAIALAAMAVAAYWAWPWIAAVALYALFLSHYQNWRGPLTQAEVDDFLQTIQPRTDPVGFRAFLETDDGGEFFMLNLIRFADGKIAHPDTGEAIEPQKLVESYSRPFIKRLLLRGGHPTLLMMRRGGDIDSWGPTAETGAKWGVTNVMRYRSRRDLVNMASMPDFDDIHRFKREAMLETINSPNKMMMAGFAGPRLFLATALILVAALGNIAILALS